MARLHTWVHPIPLRGQAPLESRPAKNAGQAGQAGEILRHTSYFKYWSKKAMVRSMAVVKYLEMLWLSPS
jgi:hypothetical protein